MKININIYFYKYTLREWQKFDITHTTFSSENTNLTDQKYILFLKEKIYSVWLVTQTHIYVAKIFLYYLKKI